MYCINWKQSCCGSQTQCASFGDNLLFWLALAAVAVLVKGKQK